MGQKNFKKVPDRIFQKLDQISEPIVVACTITVTRENAGDFDHLGLKWTEDGLQLPPTQLPPMRSGKFSAANVQGREVVRRDLPMVPMSRSWDSPNFGDWSKGYHTHTVTQMVYQREFIPPKEVELSAAILAGGPETSYLVRFAIEQLLAVDGAHFEAELLYNLNLLQENVGKADVFHSEATLQDYLDTVKLSWEFLPPGDIDAVIRQITAGGRSLTKDQESKITQRLKILEKLNPKKILVGTSNFSRYYGAQFAENFIVFENPFYGNAMYVMYDHWAELSKKSRLELLRGPRDGFDRIPHRATWGDKLKSLMRRKGLLK